MSAAILTFPAPTIRPNLDRCREALAICDHDPALLLLVARAGVTLSDKPVPIPGSKDNEAASEQVVRDRLAISFFALAELLGVSEFLEVLQ
jgi:hypothetical protein